MGFQAAQRQDPTSRARTSRTALSAIRSGAAVAAACSVTLGLLLGCTSEPEPEPVQFRPTLVWGDCPDDVETTFLTAHECGILTVLADRAEPTGGTLRLLVAKVPPPAGVTAPGLGTSFGPNFGDAEIMSGGMASGAARMGRTSLQVEWRGSGPHNSTSLACPEVDPLGARAAGVRHDDRGVRDAFVAAVAACAARLRSSGIDPGDYTVTAMAQDVEDLRVAAKVDAWQMAGSYGTQSAVLFEYLRSHPGRVRAAYLDSPTFTSPAGFHGGAAALQQALNALFRACEQSPPCAATNPGLEGLWTQALNRTAATPLRGSATVDGHDVAVVVDAAKLVRAARFALGGEGGPLTALPRIIREAAHGRLAPELAQTVATDPIFCSGYRPLCHDARFSLGLYLTNYCGAAHLTGVQAAEATHGSDTSNPAYPAAFDDSPYTPACAAWGVHPDRAEPTTANADIPLLLLSGGFDAFSPPTTTRTAANGLGLQAHVLEIPGGTHNVLGFSECALTARNDWARHPTHPPADACAGEPTIAFR
jgi:pimeloyl-ACP methyl ester carboxylesterase